jgi:hypothetical protein
MSAAPEIPLDIRDAMHDCILAVFWPKKKIIEFLLSVGSPAHLVAAPDTSLSRHMIVVDAFSKLSARSDRGYPVYQTMIDRLSIGAISIPIILSSLPSSIELMRSRKCSLEAGN